MVHDLIVTGTEGVDNEREAQHAGNDTAQGKKKEEQVRMKGGRGKRRHGGRVW